MDWQRLGATDPRALEPARVQLHWAAQVIGAAADRWIETRPDDSHTTMAWHDDLGVLLGHRTGSGLRLGLWVADLTLVAVDAGDTVRQSLPLAGETLAGALSWADARLAEAAGEPVRGLRAREYDMPASDLPGGATFAPDRPALAELGRWYANADALLREVAAAEPSAIPVRCWPHHFDIASILYLDPGAPSERSRQIGFGLSPGDGYHAEPYFYVTPYPIGDGADFPPLEGGATWQRDGFTGAVLTATALLEASEVEAQLARARAYFSSATAGARAVIPGEQRGG